jgi:L-asparaginase
MPLVVTGAIRPATAPGGDGPANLLDAVTVAGGDEAVGGGGLVVFGGEIHAATEVRKTDVTSPRAFASPRTGPVGHVAERRVTLHARPRRLPALDPQRLDLSVPIVPSFLGDDGTLLRAATALRPDGIVVVALGGGHLSPAALAALQETRDAGIPCVVTVRPERGVLLHDTYGYPGAEGDVRATGAIPAGELSAPAARIRLLAALGAGLAGERLHAVIGTER